MTRERISIPFFGKTTFWSGLSLGIGASIILYLLFVYYSEIARSQIFDSDLIILNDREVIAHNLFFAAVATTVGFGVMIWFWFHNPFSITAPRRSILYVRANALFWPLVLLLVITRMSTLLNWLLYSMYSYDEHLNFYSEFPLLLILLPTVMFFNIWGPVRLYFRVGKWFWVSIFGFLVLVLVMGFNSPIDQVILNDSWSKRIAPYNKIVNDEIAKAQLKGVKLDDHAIEILRFNKKQRVIDLAVQLKHRFKQNKTIPTDSIVMELILVKKSTIRFWSVLDPGDTTTNWPFALPLDVFNQIEMDSDPVRADYLVQLLIEYESIFDQKKPWEYGNDGLSDKHYNRISIQQWNKEIKIEIDKYLEVLQNK